MDFLLSGNLTLLLVVAGVFVATATASLWLTSPETPAARLVRHLDRPVSPGTQIETTTASRRLLGPVWAQLVERIAVLTPTRLHDGAAHDLIMAGSSLRPEVFLAIRAVTMVLLPLLIGIQVFTSGPMTPVKWGLFALSFVLGRRLPGIWLKRRVQARQKAIDRHLPYALDLLVACIEGGLSLDAAMQKVVEQSTGPLADEMRKTLLEMTLGRPAIEAMRDLGERTGAPGLKQVTGTIVQSERMGISIASTLRIAANDGRVRRRQLAEELARKAPLKMVPVLIFFIMPALAVVVMAPAVFIFRGVMQSAGG